MFKESDQQFANAAKHKAVRRQLLDRLRMKRKDSRRSIIVLSASSLIQLAVVLSVAWISFSREVLGLFSLALLFSLAAAVSETARYFALDTQIKMLLLMETAGAEESPGSSVAEPVLGGAAA